MPMTFVHPVAVLPLMRGPLVPTALVAGALAPDVPYFLRALGIPVSAQSWWEPLLNATTTHGWPGAANVAVPLAVAIYLALAVGARPARWALGLPATSTADASRRTPGPLAAAWVLVSLVLGVLTHVAWDSFTHSDGWMVLHVAALQTHVVGSLSLARLLQHLSTALGLVVLLALAWRHRAALLGAFEPRRRARAVGVVAALATAAVLGMLAVGVVQYEARDGAERLLSVSAIGAGLGVAAAAALLSCLWWVLRPDRARAR